MVDLAANDELDRVAASIVAMIHDWYKDATVAHIPESMIAKRLSRLLSASPLPSSSGTGWRPMDSAPKDGTKILYRNWFKSIGFCHWDEGYDDDDQPCWWDNEADDEVCPVVWLPADALPAFPSAPVSHGGAE